MTPSDNGKGLVVIEGEWGVGAPWVTYPINLPTGLTTPFSDLAQAAIGAAITAGDYLPHYSESAVFNIYNTAAKNVYEGAMTAHLAGMSPRVVFNLIYFETTQLSIKTSSSGHEVVEFWFSIPLYQVTGIPPFKIDAKVHVDYYVDSSTQSTAQLAIIVQEIKTS